MTKITNDQLTRLLQMFSVKAQTLSTPIGCYSIVSLSLPPPSADVFAESKSMLPPPMLKLILDVSGSMQSSMKELISTALATVDTLDDGSFLEVVTFDTFASVILPKSKITKEVRDEIKDKIRVGVINRNGCTNIEDALIHALAFGEPASILFVTDGEATAGRLTSSPSLIKMAKSFSNFSKSTMNTLGLQLDPNTALNSDLLQNLAFETNGCFRVARNTEGLASFVGDVLGGYYLRRFQNIKIGVSSANEIVAACVSPPANGFVLRADRPSHAVFKWPNGAAGPISIFVEGTSVLGTSSQISITGDVSDADGDATCAIVGCISAHAISSGLPIDENLIKYVQSLTSAFPQLIPISIALSLPRKTSDEPERGDYVMLSQQVYDGASLGGAPQHTTPAVEALRAAALQCSLTQND